MTEFAKIFIKYPKQINEIANGPKVWWEGDRNAPVHLRDITLEQSHVKVRGNKITVGQFKLRIIDDQRHEFPLFGVVVMRDGWRAILYSIFYKIKHFLEKIYRRIILTAVIWGLAQYNPTVVPSWRDINFLGWVANRIQSLTHSE